MNEDIVERLRVIHCAADDLTPCGTCLTCLAADEIERMRAEVGVVTDHVMFLIDHGLLWDDDGWSIQMPDGWRYHRG